MARTPLFRVETPLAEARFVTLYADTWDNHVVDHAEMIGQLDVVEQTLIAPTFVADGNHSDSFQFINHSPTSAILTPLVVIVTGNSSSGELTVSTAFKGSRKHLDKNRFKVRWP